jgi:rod shape-determining protein MreC
MVLLSFTVLTLSTNDDMPVIGTVRSGLTDVAGSIGRGFSSLTKPLRSWWGGATDYDKLQAENRQLREQIATLRAKATKNALAADDLKRLKEQEGIPFVAEIPSKLAQVAPSRYSNFEDNTMMIDRGATSGFRPGMPVVTSDGLVGRLEKVTDDRSLVRLITDPDFAVSIRLGDGHYGIGHGAGSENPFVVDDKVNPELKIEKGEIVVTSGLSGASFPMDIPIGTVEKVSPSGADLSQILQVKLRADLERLQAVRVLLWEPPK